MLLKLELLLSDSDGGDGLVSRKGLTMAGFFKILLGGAVGAVLGILFLKQQRVPTLIEKPMLPPGPAGPVETPVASSATSAPVVPTYVVPVYYAPPAAPVMPQAVPVMPPPFQPLSQPPVFVAPEPPPAPVAPPAPVVQAAPPPPAPPIETAPPFEVAPAFEAPLVARPVEAAPPGAVAPPVETVAPIQVAPPVEAVPPVHVPPPAPVVAEPEPVFRTPEPVFAAPPAVEPVIEVEPEMVHEPQEAHLGEVTEPELEFEVEEILASTVGAGGDAGSEVVFSPEVLDEPVPGAGWEPSAISLREEAEIEELLPMVPDTVQPYEGVQVGEKAPVDEDAWVAAGWSEMAEEAVVEPAPAEMPEPPAAEVTQRDDLTARIEETRRRIAEAAAAEAMPPIEEVWDLEPPAEEERIDVAPVAEAPAPELQPVPGGEAVEAEQGSDLKSRIEETRRRIREELEKPFAAVDEPPLPEPVRPLAAPAPAPVIGEAIRTVTTPSDGGIPAQPAAPAEAAVDRGVSDFEAMRARIEQTRSRLKAKAFDAMMAGEAALLGRDADGEGGAPKPSVSFDTEIERTVDSTLREEDR